MNEWLSMLILGIVEGLTEFLPISSTGHLIVAGSLMGMNDDKSKALEVIIQFGAILAVAWEYRYRLWQTLIHWKTSALARNIAVAFLPVLFLGPILHQPIKALLFNPITVAIALFIGGIIIIVIEVWVTKRTAKTLTKSIEVNDELAKMSMKTALIIGFMQMLAMIPGTSRSASTIIGGLVVGLSRPAATAFSFFLAIPTLGGACVYEFYKSREFFLKTGGNDLLLMLFGMFVSFVVAQITIRWLLRFVQSHSFIGFAIYRMVLALVVLWVFL